tara:strand:- start:460 stop:780 length:321 start_codon:yes stop_codon:yes gene_type:complete
MKKFPVQKKSEIGEKYVKLTKNDLRSLKEVSEVKTKELNKCPHCGKQGYLSTEFFEGMVDYELYRGNVTCTSCYKLSAIRLTKSGELTSVEKKEPLTLKEIEKLDF